MNKMAVLSDDKRYRYSLGREWDPGLPKVTWIMLNPSTADANVDDPTIRRCIGFARAWGRGGITVVNLYAFRATDPRRLMGNLDIVGPDNDEHLRAAIGDGSGYPVPLVVAAWGTRAHPERVRQVQNIVCERRGMLSVLGLTKDGHPKHPLYIKGDTWPQVWA